MKSVFILSVILFHCSLLFAQGNLEIKNPVLDLKQIKADTQARTESYKIKNTGNQPVIITRVTPMASQFKADWDRAPIPPGKMLKSGLLLPLPIWFRKNSIIKL